jgi:hypothetical protein
LHASTSKEKLVPVIDSASRRTDDFLVYERSNGGQLVRKRASIGKATGKIVASAVWRAKKGTLRCGKGGEGGGGEESQAGDRNRPLGRRKKGAKVPKKNKVRDENLLSDLHATEP